MVQVASSNDVQDHPGRTVHRAVGAGPGGGGVAGRAVRLRQVVGPGVDRHPGDGRVAVDAGEGERPAGRQRPVRLQRGAAAVVGHLLDQRQPGGAVRVEDRAGDRLAQGDVQARGAHLRAARTRPARGGVARRPRLGEAVGPGQDGDGGHGRRAGHAGEDGGPERVERPGGRRRRAAELVVDLLDQRQRGGDVVVGDRAGGVVTGGERHRRPGLARARARPGRRRVPRRPRLRQGVGAGGDLAVGDERAAAGALDQRRAVGGQRPRRRPGGPAVVVDHLLDQRQRGGRVAVDHRARARLPREDVGRARGPGQPAQRGRARPRPLGVAGGAPRLVEHVVPRVDRSVGHRGRARHAEQVGGPGGRQRPVGRHRGAAEAVVDLLHEGQPPLLVVVRDRAGGGLRAGQRDRAAGLRPPGAHPGRRRVPRRPRLAQRVGARHDRGVGHGRGTAGARDRGPGAVVGPQRPLPGGGGPPVVVDDLLDQRQPRGGTCWFWMTQVTMAVGATEIVNPSGPALVTGRTVAPLLVVHRALKPPCCTSE